MAKVNSVWQFSTAGSVRFGRGGRDQLPEQLERRGLRHPLVVSDPTISQLPAVASLLDTCRAAGLQVTLFDQGVAEPAIEVATAACEIGLASAVDCVVGIGGGSNLDVAKIAAAVLAHGGQPRDYFGFDVIPGPVLPLFALPTTAGTGSEVSHSAVLTDRQQQVKVSTLSPWMRPTVAIVDPELSDSCPASVTAHSGIDALVHAVEAYINRDFSEMTEVNPQTRAYEGSYPLTRLLAAEAIRLIGRSLVVAVRSCDQPHPGAAQARDDMALAATLAGMAFSNSGVGIVHALEYPVGALTHCSHGEGNGLLLPHVMRFNLPVRMMEFADIARWLGAEVVGLSQRRTADAAIETVEQLLELIGIRRRLSQLGLQREQIPVVAEKAFAIRRLMEINPQPVRLDDLQDILLDAY